jgi:hypothetical protein
MMMPNRFSFYQHPKNRQFLHFRFNSTQQQPITEDKPTPNEVDSTTTTHPQQSRRFGKKKKCPVVEKLKKSRKKKKMKLFSFVSSQLCKTFPKDLLNWRFLFILFIVSLIAWEDNREVEKVFYSFEDFERWSNENSNFRPFPYEKMKMNYTRDCFLAKLLIGIYCLKYNFFSDIPISLELTGCKKGSQSNEMIFRSKLYKISSRMSKSEMQLLQHEKEELIRTDDHIIVHPREHYNYTSFREFLNELSDQTSNECSTKIKQSDWSYTEDNLKKMIKEKCDLESGITLHFIYRVRFNSKFLVVLLRSVLL